MRSSSSSSTAGKFSRVMSRLTVRTAGVLGGGGGGGGVNHRGIAERVRSSNAGYATQEEVNHTTGEIHACNWGATARHRQSVQRSPRRLQQRHARTPTRRGACEGGFQLRHSHLKFRLFTQE